MSDESTTALEGYLERALTGDADLRNPQVRRIDAYKAAPVADGRSVRDLVVRSVYARALPDSRIMVAVVPAAGGLEPVQCLHRNARGQPAVGRLLHRPLSASA